MYTFRVEDTGTTGILPVEINMNQFVNGKDMQSRRNFLRNAVILSGPA